MEIKSLTKDLTVSGQISPKDVNHLKVSGVNSIICNRPDNEEALQVSHTEIKQAANNANIHFVYMPVISGQITQADVDDFAAALAELPKPIHSYCRSGMRCTSLWGLSQKQAGKASAEIIQVANHAGYDLSKLLSQ